MRSCSRRLDFHRSGILPSELWSRLDPFLRARHADSVMEARPNAANQPTHWPFFSNGARSTFGDEMSAVHSIVIHETSGWPTHQSADNFVDQYTCRVAQRQGVGPQFYVSAGGTAFQLIYIDPERLTWHATFLNGIAFGIENGDIGDENIRPPGVHWRALTTKPADQEDLAGMKLFGVVHPTGDEDVIPIWFPTAKYQGPGDLTHIGGFRMLFTEANYRTLALLCRYLAEQLKVPRNFTLLPYEERAANVDNVANFRKIVLADERAEMITAMLGKTVADFAANAATLQQWYHDDKIAARDPNPALAHRLRGKRHNVAWSDFCEDLGTATAANKRCYRGFLSHGLPGAINLKEDGTDQDDHPCPGPYFDWHRFAREVWDWWWYPFDLTSVGPIEFTRPYRQARRDTQLISYYYDVDSAPQDYERIRSLAASGDGFNLTDATPIYAMANGVLVAARINVDATPAHTGFALCRHEVFHRVNGVNIDYDHPPSYVYSLTTYMSHPFLDFENVSVNNPDWLNRFIVRLFECNSAIAFKKAHAGDAPFNTGWNHVPVPADEGGRLLARGAQMERDAAEYQVCKADLRLGDYTLFPLENIPGATPVRIILGDFLGFPDHVPNNPDGINIAIFSREELPVPGRARAVSAWKNEDWWVAASALVEDDAAKNLPADGMVWHYPMMKFLPWINDITWTSEWDKYGVMKDGARVARPPQPKSRRIK